MTTGTWVSTADLQTEADDVKEHDHLLDVDNADTVNLHPQSHIIGLSDELLRGQQWEVNHLAADNPHNIVQTEEYLIASVDPGTAAGVVPQKWHNKETGDIFSYVGGSGSGTAGYEFDGTAGRTATLDTPWESLGDNAVYAKVTYDGPAGLITTYPVEILGGVGYSGVASNMSLEDKAPIQGVSVAIGNNDRYFDLPQYIVLDDTFDISFNWIRQNAVGTRTAALGNATTGIYLLNNNDITVTTTQATETFVDALAGKAEDKQVAIRVIGKSDNTIEVWVDGFLKGTSGANSGSITIDSFGRNAGTANEFLSAGSALQGIKITDSKGRLWDFPMTEGSGTVINNASLTTNNLAWLTNSQVYSNSLTTAPVVPVERQGIWYFSGGEKGSDNLANTATFGGVQTGYYTATGAGEDAWKFSVTPDATHATGNLIRKVTAPECSATYAGPGFYALQGDSVHRAFWDRNWPLNPNVRTEMNTPDGQYFTYNQGVIWLGWAVWVPNTPQSLAQLNSSLINNHVIQFHPGDPGPYAGINATQGVWKISFGRFGERNSGTVEVGRWNKFVMETNNSTGTDNYVKIWINATDASETPAYSGSGTAMPTSNTNNRFNFKFGVYAGDAVQSNWICYFYDEFRFGRASNGAGFKDVLPGGVN